jgi:hypothetical protein
MDRDFKAAWLEGKLAGLDELIRYQAIKYTYLTTREHLQEKRREVQAELDALKEPRRNAPVLEYEA